LICSVASLCTKNNLWNEFDEAMFQLLVTVVFASCIAAGAFAVPPRVAILRCCEEREMKRSGVLVATAVLGAALVASEPAAAFGRGGGGGGFHGGFGGGFRGGFGGFRGGFGGPIFAGRSAFVGFNRGAFADPRFGRFGGFGRYGYPYYAGWGRGWGWGGGWGWGWPYWGYGAYCNPYYGYGCYPYYAYGYGW
jgi:hypothetical protein